MRKLCILPLLIMALSLPLPVSAEMKIKEYTPQEVITDVIFKDCADCYLDTLRIQNELDSIAKTMIEVTALLNETDAYASNPVLLSGVSTYCEQARGTQAVKEKVGHLQAAVNELFGPGADNLINSAIQEDKTIQPLIEKIDFKALNVQIFIHNKKYMTPKTHIKPLMQPSEH